MIEKAGNKLSYVAFYVGSTTIQGVPGLTVTFSAYGSSGNTIVSAQSASEIGGGLYLYVLGSSAVTPTNIVLPGVFHTATTSVQQQDLPAMWVIGKAGVENLDAAVSGVPAAVWTASTSGLVSGAGAYLAQLEAYTTTRGDLLDRLAHIGSASIDVTSPVTTSGAITIYRGGSYLFVDGLQLAFASTSWPSTASSGATYTLEIDYSTTDANFSKSAVWVGSKSVYCEMTSSESHTWEANTQVPYVLWCLTTAANTLALDAGTMTVNAAP